VLERIDRLKNVGLFRDYSRTADECDFRLFTLIFGENGVGKSTLSAVLDSLRERAPVTLIRRRSLPGNLPAEAVVTIGGKAYTFDGVNWDDQPPENTLDVFCPEFVNRNVYAGKSVESGHRRNLCEFVLGRNAVADVEKLAKADEAARLALEDSRRAEARLQAMARGVHTIDEYLALPFDSDIEVRISDASRALAEAKSAELIISRPLASPVVLPAMNSARLSGLLSETSSAIDAAAVAKVRAHVVGRLDAHGEEWLSYGANHMEAGICPFCAQDLGGSEIANAIGSFFGEEYRQLIRRVNSEVAWVRSEFGPHVINSLASLIVGQLAVAVPWTDQYAIDQSLVEQLLVEAREAWSRGATDLELLCARKLSNPLDAIAPLALQEPVAAIDEALVLLNRVNALLEGSASAAEEYKVSVAVADVSQLTRALAQFENQRDRHLEPAAELVKSRSDAIEARSKAIAEKEKLKGQIDDHASRVIQPYQDGINAYLKAFACNIEILDVDAGFPGGRASVKYKLRVGGNEIPLGAVEGDPCFETVLSEGDKYSLALAFFLARLRDIPDLAGRTIVLDDPVSSLGGSRRRAVEQAILDLLRRGGQVMVLTHDELLAAMLWRLTLKVKWMENLTTLEIEEVAAGSRLLPWDAERATRSQYVNDYLTLTGFMDGDVDEERAAPAVRRYVEQRIRHIFPGPPLSARDSLGQMIQKIQNAKAGDRIEALKPLLPELQHINETAVAAHHADDDPGMPQLTKTELRDLVARSLAVLA